MKLFSEEEQELLHKDGWWSGLTWSGMLARAVENSPDRLAVVDPLNRTKIIPGPRRELTWAEVDAASQSIAARLLGVGVSRSSVVAVQLPNVVELPVALLAIARIGAVACPLPVQYRRHELEPMCQMAGIAAFITAEEILGRPAAEGIREFAEVADQPFSVLSFGDQLAFDEEPTVPVVDAECGSGDLVTIVWTSGTEGLPKGVPRTYGEWEVLGTACTQSPHLTSTDVLLNPFPMVNGGGLAGMFLPWLITGSTLIQHHPFDLNVFIEQIELYRVTYTCAPPLVLNTLVTEPELPHDISSLRAVSSGSAPLPGWMIEAWERDRGVEVLNLFGSNEGGMLFSEPETVPDPGQRGRLFPRCGIEGMPYRTEVARSMRMRLVDLETGADIEESGQAGELRLKGPAIFSGYLGRGREGFDEEGWFCTGDVFEISSENSNLLVHVDRAKDLIVRGGYKISAAEVEALLTKDSRVSEAAAVAMPDEQLGERLCVYVVPGPGGEQLTLADVIGIFQDASVAKFKWPERLELTTALPRNPIGKVLKRELRKALQADLLKEGALK